MKERRSIWFLLGAILVFGSCKSAKDLTDTSRFLPSISKNELLERIDMNGANYTSAEIKKFSAEYSSEKEKRSFKGFVRYAKNEKLMASIAPAMGIEVFRILADADSIGFIDRYNKQFYRGDYAFVKRSLGMDLDFSLLAFMVSADINQLPKDYRPGKRFSFSKSEKYFILTRTRDIKGKRFLIEYNYDADLLLRRVYLKDFSCNDFIELYYYDYFRDEKGIFPKSLRLSGNNNRKLLTLNLNFKSLEFNKQLNFPFSISSKYTEILFSK